MVTRLTTLDRTKRRMGVKGQEDDTLILEVLDEVSDDAASFLGRHIQKMARTEIYRIRSFQNLIRLTGYPVDSVTEVLYHSRADDWANTTAVDPERYTLDHDTGTLRMRGETPFAPGYVRVAYTGGLVAASGDDADTVTAAFIATYPAIAGAIDQQVVETLRRRKASTGTITFKGSSTAQRREAGLLRDVRRRLGYLKRRKVF